MQISTSWPEPLVEDNKAACKGCIIVRLPITLATFDNDDDDQDVGDGDDKDDEECTCCPPAC